jgi:hypothetical protein
MRDNYLVSWSTLVHRTRSLSCAEGLALGQAWMILFAADLCLQLLSFPRVERLLMPRRPAAGTGNRDGAEEVVFRCVWATAAAARHHLWPMRCLPRSLCLRRLLCQAGFSAQLRLGVAKEEGRLVAHAWVELEGRPVGETEVGIGRFAPLPAIRTDN